MASVDIVFQTIIGDAQQIVDSSPNYYSLNVERPPGGTRANAKPPPPAPVSFPERPKLFSLLNT